MKSSSELVSVKFDVVVASLRFLQVFIFMLDNVTAKESF